MQVTLHLDDFGQTAIRRFAEDGDSTPDALVMTACLYYLEHRDSGRASWPVPAMAHDPGEATSKLTVTLDDTTWRALRDEADRQRVSAETLGRHAIMYYIADLDSGRAADELGEALEDHE